MHKIIYAFLRNTLFSGCVENLLRNFCTNLIGNHHLNIGKELDRGCTNR